MQARGGVVVLASGRGAEATAFRIPRLVIGGVHWCAGSLLSIAALGGCVHSTMPPVAMPDPPRTGEVGVTDITPAVAASGRMVLAANETFFLPLPAAGNVLPVYPPSLLVQRLPPQPVCLSVGIDAGGAVMSAVPIVQAPECPEADATAGAQFADAAMHAVRQWHFDAAYRCEYPNEPARMRGDCTGGRETAQAVSLAYRFVFEQRDGRGSVRVSVGGE